MQYRDNRQKVASHFDIFYNKSMHFNKSVPDFYTDTLIYELDDGVPSLILLHVLELWPCGFNISVNINTVSSSFSNSVTVISFENE